MPEFSYEVIKGQQIFDDPDARQKFLTKKPDNYRGREIHKRPKQSRSNPQLGYYWGLLVPEISKSIIALGWTVTRKLLVGGKVYEREVKWDRNGEDKEYADTHVFLKAEGARIGDSGEPVTLSEQDIEECSKFISNVLWICEHWLKMDVVKLEAKKP